MNEDKSLERKNSGTKLGIQNLKEERKSLNKESG